MSLLLNLLQRGTFGEPRYKVVFKDIECRKKDFADYESGYGDIKKIADYGSAVLIAEAFREEKWFLTESNILVCGEPSQRLGETLQVSISIDKNLPFLISQNREKIKRGYAVEILVEGLDLPKGTVVGPRPGYWVVFLGIPK